MMARQSKHRSSLTPSLAALERRNSTICETLGQRISDQGTRTVTNVIQRADYSAVRQG
jgi:hypothetical protein